MAGASSIVLFSGFSVYAVIGVVVHSIMVGSIVEKSSSTSSETSVVNCGCSGGVQRVERLPVIVFSVVSVVAAIGFIGIVRGSIVSKSSSVSSLALAGDCIGSCGVGEVRAVAGVATLFIFSVVLLHVVIEIVVCSFLVVLVVSVSVIGIVVGASSIRKSSSSVSAMLAVDVISGCGAWELKTVAGGSGLVVFSVVSVVCIVVGVVVVVASSLLLIVWFGGVARASVRVFGAFAVLSTVSG